MASRMIVLRQRVAAAFRSAIVTYGKEVTPELGERTGRFLEDGEAGVDFGLLLTLLERMVAASLGQLIAADKTHLDETAGDTNRRRGRNGAVEALRAKLIDIRGLAQALFGLKPAAELVAIDGRTAAEPELLWRQGEHTLTRLRDPGLRLPKASTRSIRFEPQALADELAPLVVDLRRAIDGVAVDRQEAALTRAAKKAAMADHDLLMGACGRIVSGLHLLAGRRDLARRIKISLPRKAAGSDRLADGRLADRQHPPDVGEEPAEVAVEDVADQDVDDQPPVLRMGAEEPGEAEVRVVEAGDGHPCPLLAADRCTPLEEDRRRRMLAWPLGRSETGPPGQTTVQQKQRGDGGDLGLLGDQAARQLGPLA